MKLKVKTLSPGNLFKFDNKYGKISDLEDCNNAVTFKPFYGNSRILHINDLKPVIFSDIDLVNMFNPTVVRSDYYTTFCFNNGINVITINFNHDGHVGNCFIEGKNADTIVTKCAKTLYIHDIQNIANVIGMNIEEKIFNYYRNK